MVGKRSLLLCLLLICFSAFASCRVQKPSRVKSQSVKRSEHVQSDSQDQLKNDHEQSSRVDSTVVNDQSQAQVDAKQSLPPSHTNKETSSTTSVPDNEETASSEVSDGRSEQSPSEEEGTLSQESDDTLQPGVATDEDNDDEGGGESGVSASEQEDEDGQNNDEDDKSGEREEECEDKDDERENEGDKDGKDGEDSVQEKKPATASEPADDKYKEGSKLIESLEYSIKKRGYELLQMAAEAGNNKAKAALAYGYLYGNMLKRNFTKAFEMFTWLADRGVPAGQQGLGFMYSTGIGVNASQAKAILYYTFAALGGHPSAMLTMAYRSRLGVGTSVSCEAALAYYHKVATKVRSQVSMFTGGLAVQKARLSDSDDGGSPTVFGGVSEDELEHYSEVFADTGSNVQISLGLYYMFGLGGTDKNLVKALAYLKRAAAEDYATASALIGRVYAEGSPPEIPQSNETALNYFRKSVKLNSGEGLTGLGMMYFLGMGVEKDYSVAKQHLMKAAEKGSAEAHYYIGLMLMNGLGGSPNPTKAVSHFKVAAQAGHILAIYELGQVNAKGLIGQRNCDQAVELLKAVAERGRWSKLLREAYRTYHAGEVDSALMMYLLLGEMGYEIAQSNAAYILEEVGSDMLDYNETYKRALVLWGRSASQGYATARVKLGDYYYYGLGADEDLELAAEQYRMASDRMGSPQAMFNLGYMYELGIGLEQDYHLAKRYYDMAAETSREAALPVSLALIKLTAVQYYTDLLKYLRGEGGSDQSTVSTEDSSSFSLEEDEEGVELSDFEQNWDIYLTALLCVLLVIIIRWRRR